MRSDFSACESGEAKREVMQLRTMTETDIAAGMRLKELAGWNQTEADWRRFLRASRDGCFVADVDGTVCGSAATIVYGGRFAWVGMVLVDPEYRGRGIGKRLLERCIEHLDSAGVPCIKLDATPLGKPLYEKLGFVTEYELERWILKRALENLPKQMDSGEKMPAPLLDFVMKADGEAFGADRSAILRSVNQEEPRFTDGLWNAGGMEGYAFGRHGSFADHLGPWIAKDAATGQRILEQFLKQSSRGTVVTDCLQANPFAKNILQAQGFEYARPLTRMFRGQNKFPGRPELVCSILGPEFG
ncbi:MAG: GNAT family N-acetyltransferase [Acidobacteria bacterium]|nr:GNAT family N-acetyltransferase [Acidobacteriota bacterium]MBS1866983.1 GNAT family N-acetyltransferase [Acidobacteriota bacterium]